LSASDILFAELTVPLKRLFFLGNQMLGDLAGEFRFSGFFELLERKSGWERVF